MCRIIPLFRERQREQVVRLLRESLHGSVTAVARDVVSKEAESICSSVNGMLKTLNGQLMHSVEEVRIDSIVFPFDSSLFVVNSKLTLLSSSPQLGRQNKAISSAANAKVSHQGFLCSRFSHLFTFFIARYIQ